jgi:predicted transcriptional regulator
MIRTKKVTNFMLDILMDCHEREIMKQVPVNYRTQHIKGLINRGYIKDVIATNEDTGKKELAFTITNDGKAFLARKFKNA